MADTTFKHKIVQLDSMLEPNFPFPHDYTRYRNTKPAEIGPRIQDATIVIATATKLSYKTLHSCGPKVQLIASLGAGVDNVDALGVTERGITLTNCPAQNTETVTEHAFALYFAVKRKVVQLHGFTMEAEGWPNTGNAIPAFGPAPRIAREETLGIVGYGALGKCVEKMAKALGMTVIVAERKGASQAREGRHTFDTVLRESTVLILTCPLDATTHNMIDTAELQTMRSDGILVNVGRGGIVNEAALATALREHRLGGAGVDVFETEPVTKEACPLLDPSVPNLVVTPHLAWYSSTTIRGTMETVSKTIAAFAAGKPINVVIGAGKVEGKIEVVNGVDAKKDAEVNGADEMAVVTQVKGSL